LEACWERLGFDFGCSGGLSGMICRASFEAFVLQFFAALAALFSLVGLALGGRTRSDPLRIRRRGRVAPEQGADAREALRASAARRGRAAAEQGPQAIVSIQACCSDALAALAVLALLLLVLALWLSRSSCCSRCSCLSCRACSSRSERASRSMIARFMRGLAFAGQFGFEF